jgi:membrane carboxypeptidase/penicillin-binding protein PbpC
MAPEATDGWTIGFTPTRVVGVRVAGEAGQPMDGVDILNGAAPVWHALMRYAVRDLSPEGWQVPPGISVVDVCDPSGYLPTPYCPNVAREVFLAGTEPTHPDTLFQPYRINRETGKLATLFTPVDMVEERVYFVPPPEAEAWARQAGLEPPPTEYDTYVAGPVNPDVRLTEPQPFVLLHDIATIRGAARGEDFDVYRIRFGEGLNPSGWIQIGEDGERPVDLGLLARWDTTGLDGLYTLQLMVVHGDGTVETTHVPVTIDNQPPQARLVLPEPGARFTWPESRELLLEVEASDNSGVVRVDFYLDAFRVGTSDSEPWSMRWPLGEAGQHVVTVRVTDRAGNVVETDPVSITVQR